MQNTQETMPSTPVVLQATQITQNNGAQERSLTTVPLNTSTQLLANIKALELKNEGLAAQLQMAMRDNRAESYMTGAFIILVGFVFGFFVAKFLYYKRTYR